MGSAPQVLDEMGPFHVAHQLQGLETAGFTKIGLACFWNARVVLGFGEDQAPILRRYVERMERIDAFIVVRSIISSGCTIRTNMRDILQGKDPARIEIVAPVLLEGAQRILAEEFPPEISQRFHYIWFAEDAERQDDGTVLPGLGGDVYELLRLGVEKNQYTPEIVKSRRGKILA